MAISLSTFRSGRFLKFAALPAAVVAGGVVIGNASYSAYSDTTASPANSWTTGSVDLENDTIASGGTTGTAVFSATNLKPTSTGTKCITVESKGSLPSIVKLYATGSATTNDLASNIDLTVTQGVGATTPTCTGFTPATGVAPYTGSLAAFGTAKNNFANGFGDWTTTGGASEKTSYRFTYTVASGANNSTQGGTATVGFTWEAQNN